MRTIFYSLFLLFALLSIDCQAISRDDILTNMDDKQWVHLGVILDPKEIHNTQDTRTGTHYIGNSNKEVYFSFIVNRTTLFFENFVGSKLTNISSHLLRLSSCDASGDFEDVTEPLTEDKLGLLESMNLSIRENVMHGVQGPLIAQILEPGYYVIYSEGDTGYGDNNNGVIASNIYLNPIGTSLSTPINLGSEYEDFNREFTGLFMDRDYPVVCHSLELSNPMTLSISMNVTPEVPFTMELLYESRPRPVMVNYDNSSMRKTMEARLEPGKYTLYSMFYIKGIEGIKGVKPIWKFKGTVDLLEGDRMENAFQIQTSTDAFDYQKTFDTSKYSDFYNGDGGGKYTKDVFHLFTLETPMNVMISIPSCSMEGGAWVTVMGEHQQVIATWDTSKSSELLLENQKVGTYYIVSEGNDDNGEMTLRVQGEKHYEYKLSANQNYIETVIPIIAASSEKMITSNPSKARRSINYYDPLGRLEQTVQYAISPRKRDLVTHTEYDCVGRESRKWLPVVHDMSATFVPAQAIKDSVLVQYVDSFAYEQFKYEDSPLNRIVESYGPGGDWRQAERCDRNEYFIDSKEDKCRLFTVEGGREHPSLINQGFYSDRSMYYSGELQVVGTADEDQHISFQFRDKRGLLILERQLADKDTIDTYHVYDDFGNLCFVLPPMAVDSLAQSPAKDNEIGSDTQSVLDRYAYQYRYDYRNRCIGKKLPGCEWIEMIYDSTDRLIFAQDGEQRKRREWTATLSDRLGRPAITAIYSGQPNRTQYGQKSVCAVLMPDSTLTFCGYAIQGVSFANDSLKPLLVNYYDTYDFKRCCPNFPSSLDYQEDSYFGLRHGTDNDSPVCKGLPTGSMTAVLDSEQKLYSATYYDFYQHPVQVRSTAANDSVIVSKSSFNFASQPTGSQEEYGTLTTFGQYCLYDHAGRVTEESNGIHADKACAAFFKYTYDELGRIVSMDRSDGTNSLPTENTYNIRSWLTSTSNPYSEQRLNYTDGPGTPCYNGNISSMTSSFLGNTPYGYKFAYDELSRLKDATYGVGYTLSDNDKQNYSERVGSYDKHGNILSLKRFGQITKNGCGMTDNLTLNYNGNQLMAVNDSIDSSINSNGLDFKDGVKQKIEYRYDANGNLTQDLNKKITNIQYNCLNLPRCIEFADGNSISYLYDATGTKLRTTRVIDGVTATTDYCGNVVYENGVIDKLLTNQGYISFADTTYHYYLHDHQGNNRMVVCQDGTLEELNDYYPFGGLIGSLGNVQAYKYNGKELDGTSGLNWYDYGARQYDAAIGRWHVVDPMAEKYFAVSPYVYCGANPVNNIDPSGMDYWRTNNPEEIARFMDTLHSISNAGGNITETFNFSSWDHSTDAEFTAGLTFNDETNMFYSSYGTVENGIATRVGVSLPALGRNATSAQIEGSRGRWYRKSSGAVRNVYPEFELLTLGRALFNLAAKATVFSSKELFNFSAKAAEHMAEKERAIPIQVIQQAIKGSKGMADPRGSKALMYTTKMWKNGKQYNIEVLYDKATNSIWHFKYY